LAKPYPIWLDYVLLLFRLLFFIGATDVLLAYLSGFGYLSCTSYNNQLNCVTLNIIYRQTLHLYVELLTNKVILPQHIILDLEYQTVIDEVLDSSLTNCI